MKKITLLILCVFNSLTYACHNPLFEESSFDLDLLTDAIRANDAHALKAHLHDIKQQNPDASLSYLQDVLSSQNDAGYTSLEYAVLTAADPDIIEDLLKEMVLQSDNTSLLTLLLEATPTFLTFKKPSFTPDEKEDYLAKVGHLLLDYNVACNQITLKKAQDLKFEKLSKVIELNIHDDQGQTPLIQCISSKDFCGFIESKLFKNYEKLENYKKIVSLLNQKACLNRSDKEGNTALHHAANTGFLVKLLIECGANVNRSNCQGETPIFRTKYLDIFHFFLNHGATYQ